MLSPAARRLRRAVMIHQELTTLRARLLEIAAEVQQDVAEAKAEVEAEERLEHAGRAAARLGLV